MGAHHGAHRCLLRPGVLPGSAEAAAKWAFAHGRGFECGGRNWYDYSYGAACEKAAQAHPQAEQLRKGLFMALALRHSCVTSRPGDHYLGGDRGEFLRVTRVAFARSVSQGRLFEPTRMPNGSCGLLRIS